MASRRLVWRGLDAPRMEIAHVELAGRELRARGTQIGAGYELRYELEPGRVQAEVVGGAAIDVGLAGADFFDLGFSPLFNSLPVLAGLEPGGREYRMAFVHVPSLEVERSEQRYELVAPDRVRFSSGSFAADLELDADGFVVRYEGLAERVS